MNATEWKQAIVSLLEIHQRLELVDRRGLFERHLPEPAADEAKIREVERHLKSRIPDEFRQFLLIADGWTNFKLDITLFGTTELMGGPAFRQAWHMLNEIEPFVLQESDVHLEHGIPIAVSADHLAVFFLLIHPGPLKVGTVIWFAGDEIERYQSFGEFFLAQIEYNRKLVDRIPAM